MTLNLFYSLIEISCWKILWSIFSVILKDLSWEKFTSIEGRHLIMIVMNLVIALTILATLLVVHSLIGSGFAEFASGFSPAL